MSRFWSPMAWNTQFQALSPSRRKKNTRNVARIATVTISAAAATMPPALSPALSRTVEMASRHEGGDPVRDLKLRQLRLELAEPGVDRGRELHDIGEEGEPEQQQHASDHQDGRGPDDEGSRVPRAPPGAKTEHVRREDRGDDDRDGDRSRDRPEQRRQEPEHRGQRGHSKDAPAERRRGSRAIPGPGTMAVPVGWLIAEVGLPVSTRGAAPGSSTIAPSVTGPSSPVSPPGLAGHQAPDSRREVRLRLRPILSVAAIWPL